MCWTEKLHEVVSGPGGGGYAAVALKQVLRSLSTLIQLYSLSRSYFIHLVTQHTTLAQNKRDKLKLWLNASHSVTLLQAESPLQPAQGAGRVGVNGVGCTVFIGFADINKSRTCARPLGLTPEIDAPLMGVSFSRRPGQGNRGAIVWPRESRCSPH